MVGTVRCAVRAGCGATNSQGAHGNDVCFPSPGASLGDGDIAARCPYLYFLFLANCFAKRIAEIMLPGFAIPLPAIS
jgi:hypothetical protein